MKTGILTIFNGNYNYGGMLTGLCSLSKYHHDL